MPPPGGQAVPAARRPLLRLPALPRVDLHQLPGEPQVQWPLPPYSPEHGGGLRHRQTAHGEDRQEPLAAADRNARPWPVAKDEEPSQDRGGGWYDGAGISRRKRKRFSQ